MRGIRGINFLEVRISLLNLHGEDFLCLFLFLSFVDWLKNFQEMTRIYLDNCCFNRPFDDQAQIRIKLETEAKLKIQTDIQDGKHELVWSYILEAENMANPFEERKRAIRDWKRHSIISINENEAVVQKAIELSRLGIRSKDALHLSCAIYAGCHYFLTTDDKIINKNHLIVELRLTDPIGFIKEAYNDN